MKKLIKVTMVFILALFFSMNIEAEEKVTKEQVKPFAEAITKEYAKAKGFDFKGSNNNISKSSPFAIPIDDEFWYDGEDVEYEYNAMGIEYYKIYFTGSNSAVMYYNYYTEFYGYQFNYGEDIVKVTFTGSGDNLKATIKSIDEYYFYFDEDECETGGYYDPYPLNNCMGDYEEIIKSKYTTNDLKNGSRITTKYSGKIFDANYNEFSSKIVEKQSKGKYYKTDRMSIKRDSYDSIKSITRDKFYSNSNKMKQRTITKLDTYSYVTNPDKVKLKDTKSKEVTKYNKSSKITSKRTTNYKYDSSKKKKEVYYTYSNKKKTSRKEYVYNKNGQLKSNKYGKAYQYKTTYKKGKAKKTYKYTYSKKGKLTNKTKVKIRS